MVQNGPVAAIRVYDSHGDDINISTIEDINTTNILLRRIVKLLEPVGVIDTSARQRVTVDSLTLALTALGTGVNELTAGSPAVTGGTRYVLPVVQMGIDQRIIFTDQARNTYSNAIRSNLV